MLLLGDSFPCIKVSFGVYTGVPVLLIGVVTCALHSILLMK